MMKLTRHLFAWTGDPRYADYYERALFNCRLGTQHPDDGRLDVLLPAGVGLLEAVRIGARCVLVLHRHRVEEYAKLADSIYFHTDGSLFVNLFVASELRWPARACACGRTRGSRTSRARDRGRGGAGVFTLRIRVPYWADGGSVSVNGTAGPAFSSPSSYLSLRCTWKNGDEVEVTLPMRLHRSPMPDDRTCRR